MSMGLDPGAAELDRARRAIDAARLTFPETFKGRFFRDAAKRLSRCCGIAYDDALARLHAAALAAAADAAAEQMEGGRR